MSLSIRPQRKYHHFVIKVPVVEQVDYFFHAIVVVRCEKPRKQNRKCTRQFTHA